MIQRMIRRLKQALSIKRSLYFRLCAVFMVLIFTAFAVVSIASWVTTRNISREDSVNSSRLLLQTLSNSLDFMLTDCEILSRNILYDSSVQDYFLSDVHSERMDEATLNAQATLINLIVFREAVQSIILYSPEGHRICVGEMNSHDLNTLVREDAPWNKAAREQMGMYTWRLEYLNAGRRNAFLVRVVNAQASRTPIGMMAIVLKNSYINEMLGTLSEDDAAFFIYDNNGERIFGNADPLLVEAAETSRIYEMASGDVFCCKNQEYLMIPSQMEEINWTLLRVVDASSIFDRYRVNVAIIISVGCICLLLASVLYAMITRGIINAIHKLIQNMQHAEQEGFREYLPVERSDEIGLLTGEYNRFIHRINVLVNEVYETKLRAREAEIASLQAQINPHFLYNTLNCISWKALEQKQTEISQMVVALSKMFRYSLSSGDNVVSLRQELDNVNDYLYLQKRRFEDRLDVYEEIPNELLNMRLPKYTLQPIVENSILHGLDKSMQNGRIYIEASVKDEYLIIEVRDNGVGVDLAYIDKLLSGEIPEKGNHGIRNVNERLKLLYGPNYHLSYEKPDNGGTAVCIMLPREE